jgi:hypothetical protein
MMQTKIVEAYSRLQALSEHVPGPHVYDKYVTEFHNILDLLEESSGAILANFRIPPEEMKPQIASVRRRGGGATYTKEPCCERAYFDMKVAGVLRMFEQLERTSSPSGKAPIVFNPPKT